MENQIKLFMKNFREICPDSILPGDSLEAILAYYHECEIKRMSAWQYIRILRKEFERCQLLEDVIDHGFLKESDLRNSYAVFDGKTLKITMLDILPHKTIFNKRVHSEIVRHHWKDSIADAINQLRKNTDLPTYGRAECLIVLYSDYYIGDGDNRAVKFIIDGIRQARLVPDDDLEHLVHQVVPGEGKNKEMTEIYLFNYKKRVPTLFYDL